MEEKIYILFDEDAEYEHEIIVGACKTLEEAQRGINYFLLSGREGIAFKEVTFSSFLHCLFAGIKNHMISN